MSEFISSPSQLPTDLSSEFNIDCDPAEYDPATFKLHQKRTGIIDRDALYALDNTNATVRDEMIETHQMLHNVNLYKDNLPARSAKGCPQTSIPQRHVDTLVEFDNVTQIKRSDVRGWVNLFTIMEFFKKRFRPIRETVDFNKVFGKDTLLDIVFPSKKDICELVLHGSHFAAFDFSAYYDQFEYENGISNFLCFRKGNKYFKTNRLCMGQRHACQIAQTTTLFLLDFPGRRCKKVYAYIDNVIFVGSKEDVLHDSREFIRRCKIANLTLNEADIIESQGIESCVEQSGEWCGVSLDFVNKEVKLIQKTRLKIKVSIENISQWTYRQFAAHIGLLFWCWGIVEIPLYNYYSLLKFISTSSRKLQQDESLWDTPCQLDPSAVPALQQWTKLCLENKPRKITPSSRPQWFLCTDASAWGWGYRAFNYATGEIRSYGEAWKQWQINKIYDSGAADKMKHSVYAEPLAVYCSLCHLLKGTDDKSKINFARACDDISFGGTEVRMKIGVATDNSAAQHTINRGFASRSFDINVAIKKLKEAFPESEFDIDISFVPGHMNPADGPSRGLLSANSDDVKYYNNNHNYDNNINTMLTPSNSINTSAVIGNNHQTSFDNLRRLAANYYTNNTGSSSFSRG